MLRTPLLAGALAGLVACFVLKTVEAQIVVSANDNKVRLVNGQVQVVQNPPADTVAIIDLGQSPPKVIAELNAPASVVGPPLSVAITPDESLALVTAATKIDPADPTKTVADNKLTVIDLKASPPAVIATLETGKSPAGLSINRQGTLALVANREEGTVSVFAIDGKNVTPVDKIKIADEKSGVSHAAISPDGKWALVTRDGDFKITLLTIDGRKVELAKRDINAGLRPYGIDISPKGDIAVVANIGIGAGDADTLSIIDMTAKPPRVIDTFSVGQTPEGIKFSPDGRHVGVVVMNGSNKASESPFFAENGLLKIFRVDGKRLLAVAEGKIGHWSQGVVFSNDGRTVLAQNMVERDIVVFRFDGAKLEDTGQRIKLNGGGAGIRAADKPS